MRVRMGSTSISWSSCLSRWYAGIQRLEIRRRVCSASTVSRLVFWLLRDANSRHFENFDNMGMVGKRAR